MSRGDILLWVVFPYACLSVFILGHIWRYRRDKFTWTTRSTQLLERSMLRPGILLFHVGLLMVIAGHIIGILIPISLTEAVGINENAYHVLAVAGGGVAGVMMALGLLILILRRSTSRRVATTTTNNDRVVILMLLLMVTTGLIATVGEGLIGGGYEYRETVGPWFRKLFILDPDPALMSGIPLIFQIHALSAWALFAIWPFSRLVHAWSVPITYLGRSMILFRSRAPVAKGRKAAEARR